jgi:hypothetical protein
MRRDDIFEDMSGSLYATSLPVNMEVQLPNGNDRLFHASVQILLEFAEANFIKKRS